MNLIIRDLSEELIPVKCELVMRLAIAAATKIIETITMIALRILYIVSPSIRILKGNNC